MTPEERQRLAEALRHIAAMIAVGAPVSSGCIQCEMKNDLLADTKLRIDLAVAEEREACARLVEAGIPAQTGWLHAYQALAARIRARGEAP